jgi:hypothetical protein
VEDLLDRVLALLIAVVLGPVLLGIALLSGSTRRDRRSTGRSASAWAAGRSTA